MQQARSVVSCVVERRRSDEFADDTAEQIDNNDNSTDHPRVQRLNGERVSILCQSGDPRRQESGYVHINLTFKTFILLILFN